MTVVLLLAGAFVFWRVEFALNRQLNQDLDAYHAGVTRNLASGETPPTDTPGQSYQVYDRHGRILGGDAVTRLVDVETVTSLSAGESVRQDVGSMLPTSPRPYRVVTSKVRTAQGTVVISSAISRRKHDEALRELLAQLVIADLVTLVAASLVGYGVARAALRPVERYRTAAERARGAPVLPVDPRRDDEITRLGHTLNALLARISAANERERQFLADASHELRSPLSVMRTELEMALLRPRSPAEARVALESLRDQVERLISVSNALLDLEEVQAGDVMNSQQVDARELIAQLADRYQSEAAALGRRIDTAAGTATGPVTASPQVLVEGNWHWLEVAVRNLVSNALRHGQGTVTITATRVGDRVQLTVSDEGPGFPSDFIGKAFDRFTRADTSRTSRGTGLGLSLVQAVAEAHGGTAHIAGGSVTIDLPASAPEQAPDRQSGV